MPYCPKCFSSDVEKQSHIVGKIFGIGAGILLSRFNPSAGKHVAMHSAQEHGHKYKCNKCGHEFD